MGRKPKLSDAQLTEIGRRLLAGGISMRKIAAEYGVSEGVIRGRFSAQNRKVKAVANQLVATQDALSALPINAQISAVNLAAQLRSMAGHLASAASNGAMVAHRLSGIALQQVEKVDDAEPERSIDNLKRIHTLTRMVNDSSELALNLVSANRDRMKRGEFDDDPVQPAKIVMTVQDASIPDPDAERPSG